MSSQEIAKMSTLPNSELILNAETCLQGKIILYEKDYHWQRFHCRQFHIEETFKKKMTYYM